MISVSLCMIVKNEEDVLERCLKSVAGLVDEIIIVDTGSTDRTRTMAPATAGAYRSSPYCQRMRRSSSWGHSLTTARAVRVSV